MFFPPRKSFLLFVICDHKEDYFDLFKDVKEIEVDGEKIPFSVDQACFNDIEGAISETRETYQKDDYFYPIPSMPNTQLCSGVQELVLQVKESKDPLCDLQNKKRRVKPSMILMRRMCYTVYSYDYRNVLLTIMHSNIPCINSALSVLHMLDRSISYSELKKIEKDLLYSKDTASNESKTPEITEYWPTKSTISEDLLLTSKCYPNDTRLFPIIPQNFYSGAPVLGFLPGETDNVLKVGHLHAGYGKMKIHDDHDLADFRTIVAIHNDYISAEKYISPNKNIEPIDTEIELENGSKLKVQKFPYQYDFRIQKIGDHYRLLKRHCFSGWKGNVEGAVVLEELQMNEMFLTWIKSCGKVLEGLELCALDAIVTCDAYFDTKTQKFVKEENHKFYILELNDTSFGFGLSQHEDLFVIKEMMLSKINKFYEEHNTSKRLEIKEPKDLKSDALEAKIINLQNEVLRLKDHLRRKHEREEEKKKKEVSNHKESGFLTKNLLFAGGAVVSSIVLAKWLRTNTKESSQESENQSLIPNQMFWLILGTAVATPIVLQSILIPSRSQLQ